MDIDDKIVELYLSGESMRAISCELGVGMYLIKNRLEQANVKLRTHSESTKMAMTSEVCKHISEMAQQRAPRSEESRRKQSETTKGIPKSSEHRRNISEGNKKFYSSPDGEIKKQKMSKRFRKLTIDDVKEAIELYNSGMSRNELARRFKVSAPTMSGYLHEAGLQMRSLSEAQRLVYETKEPYKRTSEHKSQMSRVKIDFWNDLENRAKVSGLNSVHYKHGKSKEPYPIGFNSFVKQKTRERDGFKCRWCGKTEAENDKKLAIHHVDANKENLGPFNLISFCNSCNSAELHYREMWRPICKEIIQQIYNDEKVELGQDMLRQKDER